MALTPTEICSRALVALDALPINSFGDNSKEAEVSAVLYPAVLEAALGHYRWRFARRHVQLTRELETPADQNWQYQFLLPSNCLIELNVTDEYGDDLPYYPASRRIYANESRVWLTYQAKVSENEFAPYFTEYLTALFKAEAAEAISGSGNVIDRARQEASAKFDAAKKADSLSAPPVSLISPANSSWVRARQGW